MDHKKPFEILESRRLFSALRLDADFAGDGIVDSWTLPGADAFVARKIVSDAAGRAVVVGVSVASDYDLVARRFNSNGSIDETFGDDGVAPILSDVELGSEIWFLEPAAGGELLVGVTSHSDRYLIRLTANGAPDDSFGEPIDLGGMTGIDFRASDTDRMNVSASFQSPTGRLIFGGFRVIGTTLQLFTLTAYDDDGTIDLTFGDSGYARVEFTSIDTPESVPITAGRTLEKKGGAAPTAIILDKDGSIVVAGYWVLGKGSTSANFTPSIRIPLPVYARLTTDGDVLAKNAIQLDPSKVEPASGFPRRYRGLQQDPAFIAMRSGGLLTTGGSVAVKVTGNFQPDPTFSGDGIAAVIDGFNSPLRMKTTAEGGVIVAFRRHSVAGVRVLTLSPAGEVVTDRSLPGTMSRIDGVNMNHALVQDNGDVLYAFDSQPLRRAEVTETSASSSVAGGKLRVVGTDGSDQVVLSLRSDGRIVARLNGVARSFAPSQIKRISIATAGGGDAITIGDGVRAGTIDAGAGDDDITASSAADLIFAREGNDFVDARGGVDTINGEAGNDSLYGSGGNDVIFGNKAYDELYGGSGDDQLFGGPDRRDRVDGGPGSDAAAFHDDDLFYDIETYL